MSLVLMSPKNDELSTCITSHKLKYGAVVITKIPSLDKRKTQLPVKCYGASIGRKRID